LGAAIVATAAAFLVWSLLIPKKGGVFQARAWSNLDGSSAYLCLSSGQVHVISLGGQSGATMKQVGSYLQDGDEVKVEFTFPITNSVSAIVSPLGLTWSTDIVAGMPDYNFCRREWSPWRLRKLHQLLESNATH